jgi:hypothetical protein
MTIAGRVRVTRQLPDEVIFPSELRGVWGGDLAPVLDGRLGQ